MSATAAGTGLMGTMVEFPCNGERLRGYLSRPPHPGRAPGLIVIHENTGLAEDNSAAGPHIKDVTDRFACEGYVGLAVDLYTRGGSSADLDDGVVMRDLGGALRCLKGLPEVRGDRIGVVGYCMGGRFALLMACHNRELAAAAVYYGRLVYNQLTPKNPVHPLDLVPQITCPVLGIYGEADTGIPLAQVAKLRERLQAGGKVHEVVTYPGAPHAFFNEKKEVYRAEAARDAWAWTLSFFAKHLKG